MNNAKCSLIFMCILSSNCWGVLCIDTMDKFGEMLLIMWLSLFATTFII